VGRENDRQPRPDAPRGARGGTVVKRTGLQPSRPRRRRAPPGTAPGTLIGDPGAPPPKIRLIAYGPDQIVEREIQNLDDLKQLGSFPVTWVNVDGLGHVETIARLGQIFSLHPLALEDAVNVHQRAKVDIYPEHLFIVARMLRGSDRLETEQVSLFVGEGCLLTLQEHIPGDVFDPVRERLRSGRGRVRSAGPAYLAYALLDAVVDQYFPVLETTGERLESLETYVIENPSRDTATMIQRTKRDLLTLRRSIWPLREMLGTLAREPCPLISEDDRPYFRDCYDHTIQVMDLVENYRELGAGLTDIYLSSINNRMNEVMKVLTIFASIFIPLNFIAGVYGMNFDTRVSPLNMPELEWYWGYLFALGLMLLVVVGLLVFFWHRGWLGERRRADRVPGKEGGGGSA
jgi:magnesium transporter